MYKVWLIRDKHSSRVIPKNQPVVCDGKLYVGNGQDVLDSLHAVGSHASASSFSSRSALDHGDVSGTVSLDADYAVHQMNLTDDVILDPQGSFGTDHAVRIHTNGFNVALADGVLWDPAAPDPIPDTFTVLFLDFDPDGWVAYSTSGVSLTEVTPEDVTFNDSGNTTTVPFTTGCQYRRNGVDIDTAPDAPEPEGDVEYTVVAKSGYRLATGSTTSWAHTYPAPTEWVTILTDTFTASDGTIVVHVPDTAPDGGWHSGASWQEPTSGDIDDWAIATNKLKQATSGDGATKYNAISLGSGAGFLGVGCGVDYVLVDESGTGPEFKLAVGSHVTVHFTKSGGSCSIDADNGGGGGAITLTGITTGIATSGRLDIRLVDTTLSILIDDVEIATGTMSGSHDTDAFVGLYMTHCNSSTFDNFSAERLPS